MTSITEMFDLEIYLKELETAYVQSNSKREYSPGKLRYLPFLKKVIS